MTRLSGWCMAAPGARVPHGQCRDLTCPCDCHLDINGDLTATVHYALPLDRPTWHPRPDQVIRVHHNGDDTRARVTHLEWIDDHRCTFTLEPLTPEDIPA